MRNIKEYKAASKENLLKDTPLFAESGSNSFEAWLSLQFEKEENTAREDAFADVLDLIHKYEYPEAVYGAICDILENPTTTMGDGAYAQCLYQILDFMQEN